MTTEYDAIHAKSHGLVLNDLTKAMSYTKKFEGLRLRLYKCPSGKLTIGYGHNIEDLGISLSQAEWILQTDLEYANMECYAMIPAYAKVNDARKFVLLDMCFNMGIKRLLTFKKMLAALDKNDYDKAAKEMLDSKWAKQVGKRAKELSEIMIKGEY